jgi:hypothetical protein
MLMDKRAPLVKWKFKTVSIPMNVDNRTRNPRKRETPKAVSPREINFDQRSTPGFPTCSMYHFEDGGALCSRLTRDF